MKILFEGNNKNDKYGETKSNGCQYTKTSIKTKLS